MALSTSSPPQAARVEDYYSSDDREVISDVSIPLTKGSNVAGKWAHPAHATKTVNLEQEDSGAYASRTAAPSSKSHQASTPNSPAKASASLKYATSSNDSGYHPYLDAIPPGLVNRPDSPRAPDTLLPLSLQRNHQKDQRPLRRSGSVSSRQSGGRRTESVAGCTDPNCTQCGPDGPARRSPQHTNRDAGGPTASSRSSHTSSRDQTHDPLPWGCSPPYGPPRREPGPQTNSQWYGYHPLRLAPGERAATMDHRVPWPSPSLPSARYGPPPIASDRHYCSESTDSEYSCRQEKDDGFLSARNRRASVHESLVDNTRHKPISRATFIYDSEEDNGYRRAAESPPPLKTSKRTRSVAGDRTYDDGSNRTPRKPRGNHHSRRSSISRPESGKQGIVIPVAGNQIANEHDTSARKEHSPHMSITQLEAAKKLEGRGEERERLRRQRRADRLFEEANERWSLEREEQRYSERAKRRQHLEREEQLNSERLQTDRRDREQKEKAPGNEAIARHGLMEPRPRTPSHRPLRRGKESQLPTEKILGLHTATHIPRATLNENIQDTLRTTTKRQGPIISLAPSVEPKKSTESSKGEDNPPHFSKAENPSIQSKTGLREQLDPLSDPSRRSVLELNELAASLPILDGPDSGAGSLDNSRSCDSEGKENSSLGANEESDDRFNEQDFCFTTARDTAMNVVKGLVLRELLECALPEATDTLENSPSARPSSRGGSAGSSTPSIRSSRTSQTAHRRKRTRNNGGGPGDDSGEGSDDDSRPKKKGGKEPSDELLHRRLKCPFYQRQPEKYTKAACRGEGFVDMAKLKDHIKRVHTQPLRCSRCWLEMISEDAYSEHIQQEDICAKRAEPQDDRIRPQLLKRLDFKKAPYSSARNVKEKWNLMFSVLFPSDTKIPSPYEQQGISFQLEQALTEALEEELSRELAPILEPIMSRIKERIPSIIEGCRRRLVNSSRSSDETAFTRSTLSSSGGNSDCELGASRKQATVRSPPAGRTASRCSESSFEVLPATEVLLSEEQGKSPQCLVPSTSGIGVGAVDHDIPSPRSSTDISTNLDPNTFNEISHLARGDFHQYPNLGGDTTSLALPGSLPSSSIPLAVHNASAVSANNRDVTSGAYDLEGVRSQQNNIYLPTTQPPTWPLPGIEWNYGSGQLEPTNTAVQEHDPFPEWDLMINESEPSHFSYGDTHIS